MDTSTPTPAATPAPAPAPTPAPAPAPVTAPADMSTWPGAFGIFSISRKAVTSNLLPLLSLAAVNLVLSIVAGLFKTTKTVEYFGRMVEARVDTPLSSIIGLVGLVVSIIITGASVYVLLSAVRGKQVSFKDALNVGKTFGVRNFVLGLLIGLTVFGGIILLIVPGIYFALRLMLAPYFLVDKNLSAMDAYKASWAATSGNVGILFGILGVVFLMGLMAVIPILGWIAGIYFIICYSASGALAYEYIQKKTSVAPSAPAPAPVA